MNFEEHLLEAIKNYRLGIQFLHEFLNDRSRDEIVRLINDLCSNYYDDLTENERLEILNQIKIAYKQDAQNEIFNSIEMRLLTADTREHLVIVINVAYEFDLWNRLCTTSMIDRCLNSTLTNTTEMQQILQIITEENLRVYCYFNDTQESTINNIELCKEVVDDDECIN